MKRRHLQTEFIKFLKENKKELQEEPEAKETLPKKPNQKKEIQVQEEPEIDEVEIQDEVESDEVEQEEVDDILTEILRDWKKNKTNKKNGRNYR